MICIAVVEDDVYARLVVARHVRAYLEKRGVGHSMVIGGDNTIADRKRLLSELRAQLNARVNEHQATLRLLDEKIEHYETHTAPSEAELFLPRGRDGV